MSEIISVRLAVLWGVSTVPLWASLFPVSVWSANTTSSSQSWKIMYDFILRLYVHYTALKQTFVYFSNTCQVPLWSKSFINPSTSVTVKKKKTLNLETPPSMGQPFYEAVEIKVEVFHLQTASREKFTHTQSCQTQDWLYFHLWDILSSWEYRTISRTTMWLTIKSVLRW